MTASESPLALAAPILACPRCGQAGQAFDGVRLACPACGRRWPDRYAMLDALDADPTPPSLGARWFFSTLGARLYASTREGTLARLANARPFADEARWIVEGLEVPEGGAVLDVPAGQGNFTAAIARALPGRKIIGLDLAFPMLRLARARLRAAGLWPLVLIRGSALDLPIADGAIDAVSACGGMHLYPDVDRAIAEMRRVLRAGGRVAGLTFCDHKGRIAEAIARIARDHGGVTMFDFDDLGRRFERAGFAEWTWERQGLVGYFRCRAA